MNGEMGGKFRRSRIMRQYVGTDDSTDAINPSALSSAPTDGEKRPSVIVSGRMHAPEAKIPKWPLRIDSRGLSPFSSQGGQGWTTAEFGSK